MKKEERKSQAFASKKNVVEKLVNSFKDAKSLTFVDFAGMDINAQQELKKRLKEVKAKMLVAKNTLIGIALNDAKLPKEAADKSLLSNQTAVILGGLDDLNTDGIAPIQVTGKFAAENEHLKFKAGILEGVFQDKEALTAISKLPSKDVLVGQTVGAIASPMYVLISNLQASVQELLGTLSAKVG